MSGEAGVSGAERHRGACLCGAVRFEVAGALHPADACHCTACRKSSGHVFVSTDVPRAALTLTGAEHVRWYQSSPHARRGFCATCGATLFWDRPDRDWTGIALGAFETPTNTRIALHIFTAEKGDYYEIGEGEVQWPGVPGA